jgi:large subunit ribosomal protein L21
MYAVVSSGGKQYKVEEGEILRVEKIPGDVGGKVTFNQVLMISDGDDVNIGQPVLADALVEGHIVAQGKTRKIIVFKYKRRKRYRRKNGHRQQFTAVKIDSIQSKTAKARQKAEPETEVKETVKKAPAGVEATQETRVKAETKRSETKKSAIKKETAKKPEAKAEAKKKPAKKPADRAEAKKKEAQKAVKPKARKAEAKPGAKKAAAGKKPAAKKTTTKKKAEDKTK